MYVCRSDRSASSASAAVAHSSQCGRQLVLHRRPSTLQRAVDGGHAHLEHRGGLVRDHERVAEDQDRALARRKMLNRGEKRELDGLSRDDRVLRLGALLEQPIRVRLEPRQIGRWPGTSRARRRVDVVRRTAEAGARGF